MSRQLHLFSSATYIIDVVVSWSNSYVTQFIYTRYSIYHLLTITFTVNLTFIYQTDIVLSNESMMRSIFCFSMKGVVLIMLIFLRFECLLFSYSICFLGYASINDRFVFCFIFFCKVSCFIAIDNVLIKPLICL